MNQVSAQRVPLDIPRHRVKMFVFLNRKRFESALIDVPIADGMPVRVPPLRMGQRQPPDKPRQFSVLARPHDQMPVIWHKAVGQQPRVDAFDGLGQDFLEGIVICLAFEQVHPRIPAVKNMINVPAIGGSVRPSHRFQDTEPRPSRQYKGS